MAKTGKEKALADLRGLIRWGYGQNEMAADAGVSASYVSSVLLGHKAPSNKLLKLIGTKKVVVKKLCLETTSNYSNA